MTFRARRGPRGLRNPAMFPAVAAPAARGRNGVRPTLDVSTEFAKREEWGLANAKRRRDAIFPGRQIISSPRSLNPTRKTITTVRPAVVAV